MSHRNSVRHHVATVLMATLVAACTSTPSQDRSYARGVGRHLASLPTSVARLARPASEAAVSRAVFGYSREGRELIAYHLGRRDATHRILIVGVIHGNESAGLAICRRVLGVRPGADAQVLVVPDLNPDGVARDTRQNADGVDLNRNFAHRWAPIGRRGDQQYSGPGPLSEPESRAIARLIRTWHPTVSVWFHQPVGVVDDSGGSAAVERRFAHLAGLPFRRLPRYPGSVVGWENAVAPATTAFVVELPRRVSAALRTNVLRALQDLMR